ncbi:MAG: PIG-L family deacetylase [Chloroflexi bacterium]|nr:PIG-L family deacetylase [Chloroflexota bacterium]
MPVPPDYVPQRVLICTPHPDDAEIGAGGTLAKWIGKGAQATLVVCTNGDKGSDDPAMTSERLAALRENEQLEAAKVLGIKEVVFLRHPDGEIEDTKQFRGDVVREIRRAKPDVVLTTDPLRRTFYQHRDHRVTGQVVLDAVFPLARDHLNFQEHCRRARCHDRLRRHSQPHAAGRRRRPQENRRCPRDGAHRRCRWHRHGAAHAAQQRCRRPRSRPRLPHSRRGAAPRRRPGRHRPHLRRRHGESPRPRPGDPDRAGHRAADQQRPLHPRRVSLQQHPAPARRRPALPTPTARPHADHRSPRALRCPRARTESHGPLRRARHPWPGDLRQHRWPLRQALPKSRRVHAQTWRRARARDRCAHGARFARARDARRHRRRRPHRRRAARPRHGHRHPPRHRRWQAPPSIRTATCRRKALVRSPLTSVILSAAGEEESLCGALRHLTTLFISTGHSVRVAYSPPTDRCLACSKGADHHVVA